MSHELTEAIVRVARSREQEGSLGDFQNWNQGPSRYYLDKNVHDALERRAEADRRKRHRNGLALGLFGLVAIALVVYVILTI